MILPWDKQINWRSSFSYMPHFFALSAFLPGAHILCPWEQQNPKQLFDCLVSKCSAILVATHKQSGMSCYQIVKFLPWFLKAIAHLN